MTQAALLRLGARLSLGSTAAARIRAATTVLALAVATVVVLAVCAIPGAAQARADRAAQRQPQARGGQDERLLLVERRTAVGSSSATTWLVAVPPGANRRPPPGVDALPEPGSSVVSPALAALLRTPAGAPLAPQFGRVVGRIGRAGLVDDHELYAYRGVTTAQLAAFSPLEEPYLVRATFGGGPGPVVDAWPWTGAVLLLLLGPLVAIVASATRLSEVAERRQLASLRLVGLTARQLQLVRLGALLPPGLAGLVTGAGAFALGSRALAGTVVAGRSWYPGDVGLTTTGLLGVVAVAAVAVLSGRRLVHHAVADPWAERRGPRAPLGRWWAPVPLALGVLLLAGVAALGSRRVVLDELVYASGLVPVHVVGLVLVIFGVFLAGPQLVRRVASSIGDRARSTTAHLAGRVGAAAAAGPARWGALLCAAVLLGGFGISYGRAVIAPYRYLDDAPVGGFIVTGASSDAALVALRHEDSDAVAAGWTTYADGTERPSLHVLIADCAQLVRVEPRVAGCRRGTGSYQLPRFPGRPVTLTLGGATTAVPAPTADLTVDRSADGEVAGTATDLLVDPSVVPIPLRGVPPSFILVRTRSAAERAAALAIVARADPAASIDDRASTRAQYRSTHALDDRAATLAVDGVWCLLGLGLLISVVDRALSAARTQDPFRAVGTSRRQRALVLALAALVPLLVLMPLAVALAALADLSWSRVVHHPLDVTLLGPTLAVVTSAITALVVGVASARLATEAEDRPWRRE